MDRNYEIKIKVLADGTVQKERWSHQAEGKSRHISKRALDRAAKAGRPVQVTVIAVTGGASLQPGFGSMSWMAPQVV